MPNIIKISKHHLPKKKSPLSLRDFHVKTYLKLTHSEKEARAFMEKEVAYSLRRRELLAILDRDTWSWKTPQRSLFEEWENCLQRFPTSGICVNGLLYKLTGLGIHTKEDVYSLLPTPCAGDSNTQYSSHSALMKYRESGHQQRFLYECQLAGLSDSEILQLLKEVMSFQTTIDG